MISRRSLFALFGGAAAAPLAKALPVEAAPVVDMDNFEYYEGWDALNTGCYYGGIDSATTSYWKTRTYEIGEDGGAHMLVCENHRDKAWPSECDCGPGMRLNEV